MLSAVRSQASVKAMTPAETKSLQAYLRKMFDLEKIEVRKREKQQDSVEVFVRESLSA